MTRSRSNAMHDGVVDCPIQGEIDVELCLRCPWLVSMNRRGSGRALDCRGAMQGTLQTENRITFPFSELHP